MTTTTNTRLHEHVETTLESLREVEDPYEWERQHALDVSYEVSADGTIRGISVTVTTGGPHIEVRLYDEVVDAHWGSERISIPVHDNDTEAIDALDRLASLYEQLK